MTRHPVMRARLKRASICKAGFGSGRFKLATSSRRHRAAPGAALVPVWLVGRRRVPPSRERKGQGGTKSFVHQRIGAGVHRDGFAEKFWSASPKQSCGTRPARRHGCDMKKSSS
jgi:hypothetical protein